MNQRELRGAVGTTWLGYWTLDPDGSLPLAQLERRSHGHLHEGRPLYIHVCTYIVLWMRGRRKLLLLLLLVVVVVVVVVVRSLTTRFEQSRKLQTDRLTDVALLGTIHIHKVVHKYG